MSFSKTISSELHDAEPVFSAALPNTETVSSNRFSCSGSQLGMELVGSLKNGVTIPKDKTLSVKLLACNEPDGSYQETAVLFSATDKALTAGELFRFVPPSTLPFWKKVSVTTDADLSAGAMTIRIVHKVQP